MAGVGQLGVAGAALVAAFCSIVLTLICAVPLAWVDQIWTRLLSRLTKPLTRHSARKPAAMLETAGL